MSSEQQHASPAGAGVSPGGSLSKLVDKWEAEERKPKKKNPRGKPGLLEEPVPPPRETVISSRASAAAKAREAYKDRHYLAAARILHKQLQHNPSDQNASALMAKDLKHINVARPYFVAHGKARTRPIVRADPQAEPEPEPEPEPEEPVPDETDDEWRKKADFKEFEAYWKEVVPELKTLMKSEPEENYGILKDSCWRLYPSIKAMFIYYAARDAAVEAKLQRAKKSQKNIAKVVDLWTDQRGANSKVSMSKTISAIEYSEFLTDTGLVSKKGGPTSLSKADAQLVFTRVNWERDDDGSMGADDDNPDFELMGHEWLHAIIRIAHALPALQSMPLHDRVLNCVQKLMYPKAKKVEMTDFPDRFASPHVENVLTENEFILKTLFTHFSASAGEDGNDLSTMDIDELVEMCRKLSIINDMCPEEAVLTSHILAQSDAGSDAGTELRYDNFLWAFCRIADLWAHNKYLKLSVKVKMLIEHAEQQMSLLGSSITNDTGGADEELQVEDHALLFANDVRLAPSVCDDAEEGTNADRVSTAESALSGQDPVPLAE